MVGLVVDLGEIELNYRFQTCQDEYLKIKIITSIHNKHFDFSAILETFKKNYINIFASLNQL